MKHRKLVFKACLLLIVGVIWIAEFALLSVDEEPVPPEVKIVWEPIYVDSDTYNIYMVAGQQEKESVTHVELETSESEHFEKNTLLKIPEKESESSEEIVQVETLEEESEESEDSDDELYFLAQVLTCEAGGCDYNEMVLVGTVIMNRIDSTKDVFVDAHNVHEVVYQDGQYDYRTIQKLADGIKPTETSLEAAEAVIEMHDNGEIFYYNGISTANILFQTEDEIACAEPLFETKWHCYSTLPEEN